MKLTFSVLLLAVILRDVGLHVIDIRYLWIEKLLFEMENLFLVIICGFLTNLTNCGSLGEPCFGCQLFNIKDKEQKSRRAVCVGFFNLIFLYYFSY